MQICQIFSEKLRNFARRERCAQPPPWLQHCSYKISQQKSCVSSPPPPLLSLVETPLVISTLKFTFLAYFLRSCFSSPFFSPRFIFHRRNFLAFGCLFVKCMCVYKGNNQIYERKLITFRERNYWITLEFFEV